MSFVKGDPRQIEWQKLATAKAREVKEAKGIETQKKFLENYKKYNCNIQATEKAIGVNKLWYYTTCKRNPEFAEQCKAIEQERINVAESKLYELIENGNFEAIRFFLKCKGGYSEKAQLDVNANILKQSIINLDPLSDAIDVDSDDVSNQKELDE